VRLGISPIGLVQRAALAMGDQHGLAQAGGDRRGGVANMVDAVADLPR
jgi:hypothetical protein